MRIHRMATLSLVLWASLAGSVGAQSTAELDIVIRSGGVGFYQPGYWGVVKTTGTNRTGGALSPLLAVTLEGKPTVQFATRLWVPSHSVRHCLTPVFPTQLRPDRYGIEIEGRFIDDSGAREVFSLRQPAVLNGREDHFDTAMMGSADPWPVRASGALRDSAGLPPTTAYIRSENAPPLAVAWEAVEALVISRWDLQLGPAQIEALRLWVLGGGRLWIMLDCVDPAWPERLLGGDWDVTVIDRVSFSRFTVRGPKSQLEFDLDYPVHMVRVTAPSMEVLHTARGYPAAMHKNVGQGELLVTTVHAKAWVDADRNFRPPLRDLKWFSQRSTAADHRLQQAEAFKGYVQEQIGHSIIGKVPVMAVLSVFAAAILGGGLWLARRNRLEHIGWVGAGAAVTTAALLVGLGVARQTRTPLTLATGQLVEVAVHQPYAEVTGLASVYTPHSADVSLRGALGGSVWPDLGARSSQLVRLVWDDFEHWKVSKLALREGAVQSARFNNTVWLQEPAVAMMHFDEQGVAGELQAGSLGPLQDHLIAAPMGNLAPRVDQTRFRAGLDDALPAGQFFTGMRLSPAQMARQKVYEALLADRSLLERPSLLAWSDGSPAGLLFSQEAEPRHSAVILVPLQIQRAEPGTRITMPAAFFRMAPVRGKRGLPTATIYDPRNGEWVNPNTRAMTIPMRFEPPQAVGRIAVDWARISFDLRAPGRPYDVLVYREGQLVSVTSGDSPLGLTEVRVEGDAVPVMTEDGGFIVGLRIGDVADRRKWTLDGLALSVGGTVLEPAASPAQNEQPPTGDSHE